MLVKFFPDIDTAAGSELGLQQRADSIPCKSDLGPLTEAVIVRASDAKNPVDLAHAQTLFANHLHHLQIELRAECLFLVQVKSIYQGVLGD